MKRLSAIFFTVITAFSLFAMPAAAADVTYIKSETAVLMEAETGAVLYNKNMHRQMYPASITKVITALLAMENCQPEDVMTVSYNACHNLPYNSSHIALDTGEQISVKNALYALAIESANDVANVFAEHIAGSNEAFGEMMTQKARELGAYDTNFTNPHGLPEDDHYTTAYDMALITAAAMKLEGFNTYFNTNRYDMGTTNIRSESRQFWNANNFINGYDRVEGLLMSKTGWTEEAKHTLVTAAERDGVTLIAVVMSSEHKQEKFDDTMALFDYGFGKYYNLEITNDIIKGKINPTVTFYDGNTAAISAEKYLSENFTVTIPKNLTEHDLIYDFSTVAPNSDNTVATGKVELFYTENDTKISCGVQEFSVMLDEIAVGVEDKGPPLLLKIALWILYIAAAALALRLIYLILRQMVILENRRRIRKRRRQKMEAKRQYTQHRHDNVARMYSEPKKAYKSTKTTNLTASKRTYRNKR